MSRITARDQGNENGLLGGITDAFAVALINISLALFAATYFFTELNHKKLIRKIYGCFSSIFYILLAGLFALFVAHYRNALGSDSPEIAGLIAYKSMGTATLSLPDFETWVLAIISFLFSIIAVIDKYKMSDPYPGYSRLERKYEKITQDYSSNHADIINGFREIKEETIDKIRGLKEDLSSRRIEYENIIASRKKIISSYHKRVIELQEQTEYLIRLYREANISTRTSSPPQYFQEPVEFQPIETFEELPQYLLIDTKFHNKVNSVFSESDKVTKYLQDEYLAIQRSFPLLSELLSQEQACE